jgi:hypothetical protein
MRKAAGQYFSIRDYASTRKISEEQAKAELLAFATGKYFPDYNVMLMAFVGQKDLHNEWKRALVAYYATTRKKELRAAGFTLSKIARWAQEMVMPNKESNAILKAAGFDFSVVPEEARYVYVETPKQLVSFDSRRNKLVLCGRSYVLTQLWHGVHILTFDSTCPGIGFHLQDDIKESGLQFVNEGQFLRAVIPATEVIIYMYNHEHKT